MNRAIYIAFILLTLISISCATSENNKEKPEVGAKDGVCYQNLECNSGLMCVDMICKNDPCYQVQCDNWKECKRGVCELSANRCEHQTDCTDTASCDVNHNCISKENPCEFQNCSGEGKGKCFIDASTNEPICNCSDGYNNEENPLACIENAVVDPCENSSCKDWETCNANNGNCDLVTGRCGSDGNCLGGKICDNNHNCVDPVNPCADVPCNNHGDCAVVDDLAKCLCDNDDGYYRDETGLNCLNPCAGNENCGGFGECKPSSATEAICTCINGYKVSGLTCIKNNLCENSNCTEWKPCDEATGACVLTVGRCDGDGNCTGGQTCDSNHNCATPDDPCEGQTCSEEGSCVVDNGVAKCLCNTSNGYYPSGLSCINPCIGVDCTADGDSNATCIPSNATTAVCDCSGGFNDVELTCIQNDPCENITCNDNWKECRNGSCELIEGKCDDNSDCVTASPACVSNTCVDLCTSLDCGANGECLSDETEAICVCSTGYTGALCNECKDGYQDNDNNGSCEPYTVWCNLQSPLTLNQEKDSSGELVFGRVYVAGVTESDTESTIIKAQLGYTIDNVSLPINDADYIWLNANYNASCSDCGNNDEYMASFPTDTVGDFKYIYRVSVDNGANWLYCDSDGVGGVNNDTFDVTKVGVATITEAVVKTLIMSEVVDHKEKANAKYVEVYNATSSEIQLIGWKIKRYANGSSTGAIYSFPDISLQASKTFVTTNNMTDFNTVFGFDADNSNSTISGNGDDVYVLVNPAGDIIDIYGEVGIDGSGTIWEYTDSVAKRNIDIVAGNSVWTASEWTITAGSSDATPSVR